MKKMYVFTLLLIISILPFSCKEDPIPEPEPEPTEEEKLIEVLNEWIWDVMTDVYFWADDINPNLYPTLEKDPEKFFNSLLSDDDIFSWISDDYEALVNSFNNITVSSGISPYFIRVSNSNEVVIIVEYVSTGSPADLAGIKRGDIITDINGTTINIENYIDLFYTEEATYSFADYNGETLIPNDRSVTLTALEIEENPVVHHEIISYEDKEIGYIVYTGFSTGTDNKWIDSLDNVFLDFKAQGIKELIIDIRYNPGGYVTAAQHLASVICPADILGNDNVLVQYQWNSTYQDYFLQTEGQNSENLVILFEDDPSVNLDLTDVYFLTSGHSASASELSIIGLRPYMNVIQIGENTYGKFYGSFTIDDTKTPARHTWAMQPIIFKYTNSWGYTDFKDGVVPDFPLEDNLLYAKQFGDITDPLLAKALEEITGVPPLTVKKSLLKPIHYEVLPDPVREMKSRSVVMETKSSQQQLI